MKRAAALAIAVMQVTPAQAVDQAECQSKVVEGQRLGLLKAMKNEGGAIVVIVSEAPYLASSFDSKTGIAKNIQCAIAGEGKVLADMQFRSDKTNKLLGQWKFGELIVE